ncbi:MAG TPA: hypothetical protein VMF06_11810 [Candidatus Limnocylindria bacterium]|jgi:hypothetical protein|nr:hypothetical protein [Candidatus Limnocylindria bacterium]
MDQKVAIEQIRGLCNQLSSGVTAIHPWVPKLADPPTQTEILKALYELTKSVEVMKKHLIKLEKKDGSTDL